MGESENHQDSRVDGSSSACSDHNGSVNGTTNGGSSNASLAGVGLNKPADYEYLQQLLKDKNNLAAFANMFNHVERLLDDEINRIRGDLFQCKGDPLILPDPVGDVVTRQEKVMVPVKSHPEYNFVGRILGPRGMTAKQLESVTGCKIMVRGKGSMRDKKKEEMNRDKPNWEHLKEELHVLIQCEDTANRCDVKIKRAKEEVAKLLVPSPEGEDELKKKQLMELAIINGTFRSNNANQQNGQSQTPNALAALAATNGGKAANFLSYSTANGVSAGLPLFANGIPNTMAAAMRSPGLTGTPLIMQQPQQQSSAQQNLTCNANGTPFNAQAVGAAANGANALALQAAFSMQLAALNGGMASTNSVNGLTNTATSGSQYFGSVAAGLPTGFSFPQQQGANGAAGNGTTNGALPTGNGTLTPTPADYQQLLLNSLQCDPAALAQYQQQQQITAMLQAQAAATANGNSAIPFAGLNGNADYMAAMAAVGGFPQVSFANRTTSTAGSIINNQRRFLGQSREHPYTIKREVP